METQGWGNVKFPVGWTPQPPPSIPGQTIDRKVHSASVNSTCTQPPTGLLWGICPTCQSWGWGICKFCTARGPGICQLWGHSQAFDTWAQVEYKNIKFINGQVRITVNFILYRKLTFLVSGTYWLKDQVVTLAADDGVVSIFQAKSLLKRRVSAVNLKES